MQNTKSAGYRLPKDMQCNGCNFLNFGKQGCFRGIKRGKPLRALNTFTNATGYIAILKPCDCNYVRGNKPQAAAN